MNVVHNGIYIFALSKILTLRSDLPETFLRNEFTRELEVYEKLRLNNDEKVGEVPGRKGPGVCRRGFSFDSQICACVPKVLPVLVEDRRYCYLLGK